MFHYVSYITKVDPNTGQMTLPEGKRKVFISYKHSDEELLPLCKQLASCILNELDVAIWYDRELTAGKEYDDEIRGAILASDVFILLLTPNILTSKYVLEQEVPLAIENQVSIIPVIAGLDEKDIPKIEAIVGRVHMPVWFFGQQTQVPAFQAEFQKQFISGLQLCIANKDLLEQAQLFYDKGSNNISLRYLTPEQIFVKAYGYLFGVGSMTDKSIGIKLMESIINIYDNDKEFSALQEQVAFELIKHLYRANQPDLFFTYMKSALAKGYQRVFPLLSTIYCNQWHPEFLCNEYDLSLTLFKKLYQTNFGKQWDADEIMSQSEEQHLQPSAALFSGHPHVGELTFDGHTAYFQKSDTDKQTTHLIVDNYCVASYSMYASYGDAYFLYMAYDPDQRILIVLHADFDHYGPETITSGKIFRIQQDAITAYDFRSDWLRGRRELPYSPSTFKVN